MTDKSLKAEQTRIPTILIAKDEPVLAQDLCDTVEEAGFEVEGPHDDVGSAMLAIQKHKPDLAILDTRLGDEVVYPLAERIMAEDVPVIFHSARVSPEELENRYPQADALAKPCPPNKMIDTITGALAA